MEIGSKIKALRLKSQLTQEELADRCELTKGYISQLENDLTSPSITTLEDICETLGTNLVNFFGEDEKPVRVVYTKDDHFVKSTESMDTTWLVTNSTINEMEPILVELKSNCQTEQDNPHEGEEFGYVLEGSIVLTVGKRSFVCKKGDSFHFTADKVHYIRNDGKKAAKLLWISSPPNF